MSSEIKHSRAKSSFFSSKPPTILVYREEIEKKYNSTSIDAPQKQLTKLLNDYIKEQEKSWRGWFGLPEKKVEFCRAFSETDKLKLEDFFKQLKIDWHSISSTALQEDPLFTRIVAWLYYFESILIVESIEIPTNFAQALIDYEIALLLQQIKFLLENRREAKTKAEPVTQVLTNFCMHSNLSDKQSSEIIKTLLQLLKTQQDTGKERTAAKTKMLSILAASPIINPEQRNKIIEFLLQELKNQHTNKIDTMDRLSILAASPITNPEQRNKIIKFLLQELKNQHTNKIDTMDRLSILAASPTINPEQHKEIIQGLLLELAKNTNGFDDENSDELCKFGQSLGTALRFSSDLQDITIGTLLDTARKAYQPMIFIIHGLLDSSTLQNRQYQTILEYLMKVPSKGLRELEKRCKTTLNLVNENSDIITDFLLKNFNPKGNDNDNDIYRISNILMNLRYTTKQHDKITDRMASILDNFLRDHKNINFSHVSCAITIFENLPARMNPDDTRRQKMIELSLGKLKYQDNKINMTRRILLALATIPGTNNTQQKIIIDALRDQTKHRCDSQIIEDFAELLTNKNIQINRTEWEDGIEFFLKILNPKNKLTSPINLSETKKLSRHSKDEEPNKEETELEVKTKMSEERLTDDGAIKSAVAALKKLATSSKINKTQRERIISSLLEKFNQSPLDIQERIVFNLWSLMDLQNHRECDRIIRALETILALPSESEGWLIDPRERYFVLSQDKNTSQQLRETIKNQFLDLLNAPDKPSQPVENALLTGLWLNPSTDEALRLSSLQKLVKNLPDSNKNILFIWRQETCLETREMLIRKLIDSSPPSHKNQISNLLDHILILKSNRATSAKELKMMALFFHKEGGSKIFKDPAKTWKLLNRLELGEDDLSSACGLAIALCNQRSTQMALLSNIRKKAYALVEIRKNLERHLHTDPATITMGYLQV